MAAALGSHVAPPLRPSPMKTSSIAPPSFKRTPKKKTTTTTNKKKQSSRAVDHHSTPLLITPVPTNPSPAPILPPEFFLVDALDLAPRLLGKLLRRDEVVLRITEV